MSDDLTDADIKALCAHLDIETITVTDAFGRSHIAVNEAGMRKLADHAPIGAAAAHAKVDQMFAAIRDHYGL